MFPPRRLVDLGAVRFLNVAPSSKGLDGHNLDMAWLMGLLLSGRKNWGFYHFLKVNRPATAKKKRVFLFVQSLSKSEERWRLDEEEGYLRTFVKWFDLTAARRKANLLDPFFPDWPRRVSVARDSTVAPHSSHAPCLGTLA